jgi:hypothetical protein
MLAGALALAGLLAEAVESLPSPSVSRLISPSPGSVPKQ